VPYLTWTCVYSPSYILVWDIIKMLGEVVLCERQTGCDLGWSFKVLSCVIIKTFSKEVRKYVKKTCIDLSCSAFSTTFAFFVNIRAGIFIVAPCILKMHRVLYINECTNYTLYQVIHKSLKHFKNSQQIDYATNHDNSYADRERNSPSSFYIFRRCSMCPPLVIRQTSMR
jgi:hypothetical protein